MLISFLHFFRCCHLGFAVVVFKKKKEYLNPRNSRNDDDDQKPLPDTSLKNYPLKEISGNFSDREREKKGWQAWLE
jgi:hypothetical protein